MTHFIFIHDFYRDGYSDVLAEVRVLQVCGQWTKEKRADFAKYEVSAFHAAKHKFPRMDTSYWAGRVAAIKSAMTSAGPKSQKEQRYGRMLFLALGNGTTVFCGSCGDRASWKWYPDGTQSSLHYQCDPCKQEQVRAITAYSTPDGWDWDEHELRAYPVPQSSHAVLRVDQPGPIIVFTSFVLILGLGLLDMTLHLLLLPAFLELFLILYTIVYWEEIVQEFHKKWEV